MTDADAVEDEEDVVTLVPDATRGGEAMLRLLLLLVVLVPVAVLLLVFPFPW